MIGRMHVRWQMRKWEIKVPGGVYGPQRHSFDPCTVSIQVPINTLAGRLAHLKM